MINAPTGPAALSYGNASSAYEALTNQYYSVIPHSFGRNRPTIINHEATLKKELEVLDALGDMEIASKVLSNTRSQTSAAQIHPIDAHLASLQLSYIVPLDRKGQEFRSLEKYAHDTHGATHSHYKVEVSA